MILLTHPMTDFKSATWVLLVFLLLGPALALSATPTASPLLRVEQSTTGTTLWLRMKNGPFPCDGKPYRDATTALFVPTHYKPQKQIDMLVHFHGHDGLVPRKIVEHQLREQVAESGRNILFVMPQGPTNAGDSAGGKLELQAGFAAFTTEMLQMLQRKDVRKALILFRFTKQLQLGHVALSAHSGGYHVTAKVLELGGVPVREVFLFDALYADVPLFRDWLAQQEGQGKRLILWFTGGAPMQLGQILRTRLREAGVHVSWEDPEGSLTWQQFCRGPAVMIHTGLKHGQTPWGHNNLRDALLSSRFGRVANAGPMMQVGKNNRILQGRDGIPAFLPPRGLEAPAAATPIAQ